MKSQNSGFPENRAHYVQILSNLQDKLLDLASLVDKSIQSSITSLKEHNFKLAEELIEADAQINLRRYKLEEEALFLLATQQPVVSRDLRLVAAVMYITSELERMGDYAKGLARISERMDSPPPLGVLVLLEKMILISQDMFHQALDAFLLGDAQLARQVAARDDEIDELYNQACRELLEQMMSNQEKIDNATYMLWALHNVERMGDRITNICERVIFMETGIIPVD